MSERISIKGQGKALFFGEDDSNRSDQMAPEPIESVASGARQTDSPLPEKTDSHLAGQTASKTARQTDNTHSVPTGDQLRRLRDVLLEDHPVHNTFRYSQDSLDAVRDIVYELEVKRGIKTSRNDVMRLGLAWLVDDYRTRREQSVLVQVLKAERWKGWR